MLQSYLSVAASTSQSRNKRLETSWIEGGLLNGRHRTRRLKIVIRPLPGSDKRPRSQTVYCARRTLDAVGGTVRQGVNKLNLIKWPRMRRCNTDMAAVTADGCNAAVLVDKMPRCSAIDTL